jgi:phenylalanine-4-hydroxylase
MDKCLKKLGWRAAGISGFIPPAAFMELQAHGILPIATEMRRIENLDYTPAPDIVHEAAGHAPMLANKEFSAYLKQYAEVASKAIITKKDLDQYEAIRELSDLKELPTATPEQIERANQKCIEAGKAITEPTEAVLLARMGWWSTEYGLMGNPPKIIGAGLLSSAGESRVFMDERVKKIPFSIDCTKFGYDITDPQPQLFVANNFKDLQIGLEQLAEMMAFRKGGTFGLKRMLEAETVNTIQLNSGLQISGKLQDYKIQNGNAIFIKLTGPTQLCTGGKELQGHSKKYHAHGFSSPIGLIKGQSKCLSTLSKKQLSKLGIKPGSNLFLEYESGLTVSGKVKRLTFSKNRLVILALTKATVLLGTDILYDPNWGPFDMAIGSTVESVFGGPADRAKYGPTEDFKASILPKKKYSDQEKRLHEYYKKVALLRANSKYDLNTIKNLYRKLQSEAHNDWLIRFEILELAKLKKLKPDWENEIIDEIRAMSARTPDVLKFVESSLNLIGVTADT